MSISSSNMDTYKEVLYAAGLPALISTGITLLYLLLKAYQSAVYALPHQTEGRLAAATPGGHQQEHGSIAGEKGYIAGHILVFIRESPHTWGVISWSLVLSDLSDII